MATNDFLTFAGDPAADVLPQSQYIANGFTARILGFSTGTALSIQLNKVWRQASLISAMIGQFTVDEINQDMLDDGTPAGMTALETHFRAALVHVAQSSIGTNFLPLTGGALSGPLQINASTLGITAPSGSVGINLTRQQGMYALLTGYTGVTPRWQVMLPDNTAEQGSNSGSNFNINCFNDQGGYLDTPLSINRATGVVNFSHGPTVNGASLPYVRLAGDVMSGVLGVGGTGISYNGLGGYWAQHHIAFGWDGNVNVAVDGTFVGQIAMQSWVGTVVGGYLPLGGGTLSGPLNIHAALDISGTTFNHSTTYFGYNDFANFWDGRYRYRQWAGSWYDAWDGQTGLRAWAAPNAWIMTLDGVGNLGVSGAIRANGARIISIGSTPPTICCYWTGGVAKGMYVDQNGLLFCQMDGGGNWLRSDMLIGNNGYITHYGSGQSNGNWYVVGQLTAANNFGCGGTAYLNVLSAGGWSYLTGVSLSSDAYIGGNLTVNGGSAWLNGNVAVTASLQVNGNINCNNTVSGAVVSSNGYLWANNRLMVKSGYPAICSWNPPAGGAGGFWALSDHLGFTGMDGNGNPTSYMATMTYSGWLYMAGGLGGISDAKVKHNITPSKAFDSLAAIRALISRAFDWNYDNAHQPFGLIASEVSDRLPDVVRRHDDTDYLDLTALLVHALRAIQQLANRIEGAVA